MVIRPDCLITPWRWSGFSFNCRPMETTHGDGWWDEGYDDATTLTMWTCNHVNCNHHFHNNGCGLPASTFENYYLDAPDLLRWERNRYSIFLAIAILYFLAFHYFDHQFINHWSCWSSAEESPANCNRRLCSAAQSSLIRGMWLDKKQSHNAAIQLSDAKHNEREAFDSNKVSIGVILPFPLLWFHTLSNHLSNNGNGINISCLASINLTKRN